MKDTIKADDYFEVFFSHEHKNTALVYDGMALLFRAQLKTHEDYVDEVINGGNECARIFGIFTDRLGRQYVYWNDYETDEDFLTQIS